MCACVTACSSSLSCRLIGPYRPIKLAVVEPVVTTISVEFEFSADIRNTSQHYREVGLCKELICHFYCNRILVFNDCQRTRTDKFFTSDSASSGSGERNSSSRVQERNPGIETEAQTVCIHCLQISTAQTIKI